MYFSVLLFQVKRFEACKRFFECKKCKKRTFAFDKYPKKSCLNCGGSAWERTGMMRERKGPKLDNEKLLIRGQEQTFVGATVSGDQLNVNSLAWGTQHRYWYRTPIAAFTFMVQKVTIHIFLELTIILECIKLNYVYRILCNLFWNTHSA